MEGVFFDETFEEKDAWGTSLALSLFVLSACGSEVATTGASVDTSALQEKIAGLEKKLVEQGAKSVEQEQRSQHLRPS